MNRVATSTATISVTPAGTPTSVGKKHPIYTTAGTIYNPSANQPLQPPLRRGRALKWASPAALDLGQLALFPEEALLSLNLNLNLLSQSRYSSLPSFPTTTAAKPALSPTYQPLQQNLDRAVKPKPHPAGDIVSAHASKKTAPSVASSELSASIELVIDMPQAVHNGGGGAPLRSRNDDITLNGSIEKPEKSATPAVASEELSSKSLDQLPVKALFSLMSYPNPNQEQARRRWEMAKGMGSAGGASGSVPMSAKSWDSISDSKPYTLSLAGSGVSSTARQAANDATCKPSLQSFDFPVDYKYRSGPNTPIGGPSSSQLSLDFGSRPSSFTPNFVIPPPAPLTAGPPGQRQYRPTMPSLKIDTKVEDGHATTNDYQDPHLSRLGSAAIVGSQPMTPVEHKLDYGVIAPPARRHVSHGGEIVANLEAKVLGTEPHPSSNGINTFSTAGAHDGASSPRTSTGSYRAASGFGVLSDTATGLPPHLGPCDSPNAGATMVSAQQFWEDRLNESWYRNYHALITRLGGPKTTAQIRNMSLPEVAAPFVEIALEKVQEFVTSGQCQAGMDQYIRQMQLDAEARVKIRARNGSGSAH